MAGSAEGSHVQRGTEPTVAIMTDRWSAPYVTPRLAWHWHQSGIRGEGRRAAAEREIERANQESGSRDEPAAGRAGQARQRLRPLAGAEQGRELGLQAGDAPVRDRR